MADFLRPEARAALWRLRGLVVALSLAGFGLWWALTAFGFLRWLGWGAVVAGLGLALAALQRLRFGQHKGGPGVVQVDERRLSYFGPLTGGIIDLDDLVRLAIDGAAHPPHWILTGPGGQVVQVPITAEGADSLFDAFAALPGLPTERLIAAVQSPPAAHLVLWQAPKQQLR